MKMTGLIYGSNSLKNYSGTRTNSKQKMRSGVKTKRKKKTMKKVY